MASHFGVVRSHLNFAEWHDNHMLFTRTWKCTRALIVCVNQLSEKEKHSVPFDIILHFFCFKQFSFSFRELNKKKQRKQRVEIFS